jgi:hypothetical protein
VYVSAAAAVIDSDFVEESDLLLQTQQVGHEEWMDGVDDFVWRLHLHEILNGSGCDVAGGWDEDEGRMVAAWQYLDLERAKTESLSRGRLVEFDVVQNPLLWCVACKSICEC